MKVCALTVPPRVMLTFLSGASFDFQLQFSNRHPFQPPRIRFLNYIYHPLFNDNGLLHVDLLCCKWSPAVTLRKLLLLIRSLLIDFGEEGIPERLAEYQKDPIQFRSKARDCVRYYNLHQRSLDLHYVAPHSLKQEFRTLMLVYQRLTNPEQTSPCFPSLPIEVLILILRQLEGLYSL